LSTVGFSAAQAAASFNCDVQVDLVNPVAVAIDEKIAELVEPGAAVVLAVAGIRERQLGRVTDQADDPGIRVQLVDRRSGRSRRTYAHRSVQHAVQRVVGPVRDTHGTADQKFGRHHHRIEIDDIHVGATRIGIEVHGAAVG
jgi:hypothetical protein